MSAIQNAIMLGDGLEQDRARLKQALLERERLWQQFGQAKQDLDGGIDRLSAEIESLRYAIQDYEGAAGDKARAAGND